MLVSVRGVSSFLSRPLTSGADAFIWCSVVVDSNAQLLEAVQQAETESEQMRATHAALHGELANARGAVAERENTKYAADEQLSLFRQQSEEYTQLSRTLRDELAQAKAAQAAAEEKAAAAGSLRTAADVGNAQLQRQVRTGCSEKHHRRSLQPPLYRSATPDLPEVLDLRGCCWLLCMLKAGGV